MYQGVMMLEKQCGVTQFSTAKPTKLLPLLDFLKEGLFVFRLPKSQ